MSSSARAAAATPFADGGSPPGLPTQAGEEENGGGSESYLQNDTLGPSGSKAIWSFWVQLDSIEDQKESKFPDSLIPLPLQPLPGIESGLLQSHEFAVKGGSYQIMISVNGDVNPPPRIPIFPIRDEKRTWLHKMVPFICWGEPNEYEPMLWPLRVIEPDYYFFGPGGGYGPILSQQPQSKEDFDAEQKEAQDLKDRVGPMTKAESDKVKAADMAARGGQTGEGEVPTPPSMFAVREDGRLRIILQTNSKADYTGYCWAQTKAERVHILTPCGDRHPFGKGLPLVAEWRDFDVDGECLTHLTRPDYRGEAFFYTDVSNEECNQQPECFVLDPDVRINDGKWHHILFSYDLGEGAAAQDGPATGSPPGLPTQASASGGPSVTPFDLAGDLGINDIGKGVSGAEGGGGGAIVFEATGGSAEPCHPGMYGEFSGPNLLFGVPIADLDPRVSGAPFEDCGKAEMLGPADGAKASSKCKAWLMIDGKEYTGKDLNYSPLGFGLFTRDVYRDDIGLGPNDIAPPNAWLAVQAKPPPEAGVSEIRPFMVTSLTKWERGYRAHLGNWTGPPAKIKTQTDEKRRYDYARPKYEFTPEGLAGGPLAIPAGTLLEDRNFKIKIAELHIWDGRSCDGDIAKVYELTKDPGRIMLMDEDMGRPTIRLHWASNWKYGLNTGTSGQWKTGPSSGFDAALEEIEAGQFKVSGSVERFLPDPRKPGKKK